MKNKKTFPKMEKKVRVCKPYKRQEFKKKNRTEY